MYRYLCDQNLKKIFLACQHCHCHVMKFLAKADGMVWPLSSPRNRKWPLITKCTHISQYAEVILYFVEDCRWLPTPRLWIRHWENTCIVDYWIFTMLMSVMYSTASVVCGLPLWRCISQAIDQSVDHLGSVSPTPVKSSVYWTPVISNCQLNRIRVSPTKVNFRPTPVSWLRG